MDSTGESVGKERELLRQERLRLEEERRRLEYDRRKFVDAGRCNDRRYRFSPVSHVGRRLLDDHYVADNDVQTIGRKRRSDFDSDCLHSDATSNYCYGHSMIECERFDERPRSPKCFRRDSPLFGHSRSAYTPSAGQDSLDDHWNGSAGEEDMECLSFSSTMEPTDDVLMVP